MKHIDLQMNLEVHCCKRKKGLRFIRFMRLYYIIHMVNYLSYWVKRLGAKESNMLK
jgi:hypothetical protein